MALRLLVRLVVLALIIGLVAKLVPGIHVHGGFWALLWISVLFSLVNAILGPLFKLLSLPLIVLTLGIFLLVVNAALLGITAGLSKHLDIDSFGSAVLGGLLIAVFSWLAELVLPTKRSSIERRERRRRLSRARQLIQLPPRSAASRPQSGSLSRTAWPAECSASSLSRRRSLAAWLISARCLPGPPAQRRPALGVDRGQQQAAEHAGVLHEVQLLLLALGRIGLLPEPVAGEAWSAPGWRPARPPTAAGTCRTPAARRPPTLIPASSLTTCSVLDSWGTACTSGLTTFSAPGTRGPGLRRVSMPPEMNVAASRGRAIARMSSISPSCQGRSGPAIRPRSLSAGWGGGGYRPGAARTVLGVPAGPGKLRLLHPKWLLLHAFTLAAGVAMVLLGRWQWHVAHRHHGDIRYYAYAVPVVGLRGLRRADVVSDRARLPAPRPARPRPAGRAAAGQPVPGLPAAATGDGSDPDPERARFNAYLAQLDAADRDAAGSRPETFDRKADQ